MGLMMISLTLKFELVVSEYLMVSESVVPRAIF